MKTSPVVRVHNVLSKVAQQNGDAAKHPMLHTWAQVFAIPYSGSVGHPPADVEEAVWIRLINLRREIRLVEQAFIGTDSEQDIAHVVQKARMVTSVSQFSNPCETVKSNYLQPEVLTAWRFATRLHIQEEEIVQKEDLEAIQAELSELESLVKNESVPEALRIFILRQIELMRGALALYDVCGVAPLVVAIKTAYGDTATVGPEVAEGVRTAGETGKNIVARLKKIIDTAVAACDKAVKLQKGGELIIEGYEKALPLAHDAAHKIADIAAQIQS